jgi:hypothetical protein
MVNRLTDAERDRDRSVLVRGGLGYGYNHPFYPPQRLARLSRVRPPDQQVAEGRILQLLRHLLWCVGVGGRHAIGHR